MKMFSFAFALCAITAQANEDIDQDVEALLGEWLGADEADLNMVGHSMDMEEEVSSSESRRRRRHRHGPHGHCPHRHTGATHCAISDFTFNQEDCNKATGTLTEVATVDTAPSNGQHRNCHNHGTGCSGGVCHANPCPASCSAGYHQGAICQKSRQCTVMPTTYPTPYPTPVLELKHDTEMAASNDRHDALETSVQSLSTKLNAVSGDILTKLNLLKIEKTDEGCTLQCNHPDFPATADTPKIELVNHVSA